MVHHESRDGLAPPPFQSSSPPLVPINEDDKCDVKKDVEDWCKSDDVEPIASLPDPSHSFTVIPFQSPEIAINVLSKDIKHGGVGRESQRMPATRGHDNISAELKRKLSMESMSVHDGEVRIKEQRSCIHLSPPPSEMGDTLGEREEHEGRIGEGTYGRVFKKAGQAIKTALNSLESRRCLEREASILKSLSHPNIIEFYDFKEYKLYMELADGSMKHKRECSDLRVVARELFRALNYIHGKGIIHGDLKPANLLQKNGSLRLCDFGQSKYEHEMHASTGTTVYVAPECLQLLPRQTFKSDVYSAGACMYYLMTGRDPFQQVATKSTVQLIIKVRAGFFRTKNVHVDHDNPLKHEDALLVEIVERCTRREAGERPTAREVLDLLVDGIK